MAKSKSFSITLNDLTAQALDDWAASEGRSRGNLISFVLELAARHKYPERYTDIALPEPAIDPTDYEALKRFICKLAEGIASDADGAIAAHIADIDPNALIEIIRKSKNVNRGN